MGTIPSPRRYDVVLESTLSTTNARPGGRSFYAGRRMTGVPGLQTGMALPVPSRMTRPGLGAQVQIAHAGICAILYTSKHRGSKSCAQRPSQCGSTLPPRGGWRGWPRARAAAVLSSRPRRSTSTSTSTSGRLPASSERSRLSIVAKEFRTSGSKIGSRRGAVVESGRSLNVHDPGLVA